LLFSYVCLSVLQRRMYIRRCGPGLLCERQRRAGPYTRGRGLAALCVCEMVARDAKNPPREEGAVEPIRERIEDFMRRYGYEENRVLRVLAAPMLIVAILAVGVAPSRFADDTQGFHHRPGRGKRCCRHRRLRREARIRGSERRTRATDGLVVAGEEGRVHSLVSPPT
jgi:hypothetical protein